MPDRCTPDNCIMTHRIEVLEEANKQHSKTHADMFDRLRALETHNAVQDAHYQSIDTKLDELTVQVKELNQKLSVLEAKPGKRWDSIVDKAIWAVCAAVIAFLLARMGL